LRGEREGYDARLRHEVLLFLNVELVVAGFGVLAAWKEDEVGEPMNPALAFCVREPGTPQAIGWRVLRKDMLDGDGGWSYVAPPADSAESSRWPRRR